jgi:hypothetical protein
MVRTKVKVERQLESAKVFLAMHEECTKCRAHINTAPNANPVERTNRVDQPAVVDVQAGKPKHAPKEQ